jgi:hypothetical protein
MSSIKPSKTSVSQILLSKGNSWPKVYERNLMPKLNATDKKCLNCIPFIWYITGKRRRN